MSDHYPPPHKLKPGEKLGLFESDGMIIRFPLIEIDNERYTFISAHKMDEYLEKAKAQEIELENRREF